MQQALDGHLPAWLADTYHLPESNVTLLRAYTNDVHVVVSAGARRVLKIYAPGWRSDDDIRWEIDLFRHLAAHGIDAPTPIAGRNGEFLQRVEINGVARQAVLFPFAEGNKPQPPFPPEIYAREAMSLARLHEALDSFDSTHTRPGLDLDYLLRRPMATMRALAPELPAVAIIDQASATIAARIEALAGAGLDWGPCHGDVTFDNVHVTDDGRFVWYDFDSGGPGWRGIDLQGWAAHHRVHDPCFRAFVEGYRSVRPLAEADVSAAPWLHLAQEVWGVSVELERRVAARGEAAVARHLGKAAAGITSRLAQMDGR